MAGRSSKTTAGAARATPGAGLSIVVPLYNEALGLAALHARIVTVAERIKAKRGFAIEAEITARLLRKGIRIYEVPVDYRARTREEGKKLTAMDGVRVLGTLLRCRIA